MAKLSPNAKCTAKMTPEERHEYCSKGGKASAAAKKARKTLREELLALLEAGDTQERMSLAMIQKVLNGGKDAVAAFNSIRDTIGEKVSDKVEISTPNVINISIEDAD